MSTSRRDFMKVLGASLAAIPFASGLFSLPGRALAADLPPASENEGMAKNLGYCIDADKKNNQACSERSKDKTKAGQYCDGCQLYTKINDKVGKCMLIQKNTVSAKGWCKSFVKRPA